MKTWLINCCVSMTYEIEAETEAEAHQQAAELFAVDIAANMADFEIVTELE